MSTFWKCVIVFIIGMIPVVELRGAIPIGMVWLDNNYPLVFSLSLAGNIIIVPFIVLLFHKILWVLRKIRITAKVADMLERRAEKNTEKVQNLMFLGLMLFVAIPLPGTGAWTASMIAGLLKLPLKKAIPPIALGVVIAGVIVTVLYYCFRELFLLIV
ncbi:MAG: small multi-drug export protein [Clostridia bacterium]|nr:small multi-drug export protein [Clostridia bacterium]